MILGVLPAAYPDDPCNDAAMPKLESCLLAEDRGPCEDRIRQLYKRCEQKEPDQQPAHDTYRSPITTREEVPMIARPRHPSSAMAARLILRDAVS